MDQDDLLALLYQFGDVGTHRVHVQSLAAPSFDDDHGLLLPRWDAALGIPGPGSRASPT